MVRSIPLVVPLSAVLPPIRAVQPVGRFYRWEIRYNRNMRTTHHCSGFSAVAFVVCFPLILAGFRVFSSCVCSGGSSSRSAPRKTKKRARRTLRPVVSNDEEVVIPTKPTRREKSAATKQRVVMPLHRWKSKDLEAFRSKNPYEVPIAPRWTTI